MSTGESGKAGKAKPAWRYADHVTHALKPEVKERYRHYPVYADTKSPVLPVAASMRHSKVQQQVLSLYKRFLRVTEHQPGFQQYVKAEFRRNAALPRSDVIHIEYLLRRGWRQLDMLRNSCVSRAGLFEGEPEQ